MSTPLPRHRDMPVSYQAGGRVYVLGHKPINALPVAFKTDDNIEDQPFEFECQGRYWFNNSYKLCVSWENDYSFDPPLGYFHKKGIRAFHPYSATHRIICCAMPSASQMVTLEFEYETTNLSINIYAITGVFSIAKTYSRIFHNASRALDTSALNWHLVGNVGAYHYIYNDVLPAFFSTDAKNLFLIDDGFVKHFTFNADYNAEDYEIITIASGLYAYELNSFKDQATFSVGDADVPMDDAGNIKHAYKLQKTGNVYSLVDTGFSLHKDREFLYADAELALYVFIEKSVIDTDVTIKFYLSIDGVETLLYTNPVFSIYTVLMYAAYDGKTLVVPLHYRNEISGYLAEKTLVVNTSTMEHYLLDYSLEYFIEAPHVTKRRLSVTSL